MGGAMGVYGVRRGLCGGIWGKRVLSVSGLEFSETRSGGAVGWGGCLGGMNGGGGVNGVGGCMGWGVHGGMYGGVGGYMGWGDVWGGGVQGGDAWGGAWGGTWGGVGREKGEEMGWGEHGGRK